MQVLTTVTQKGQITLPKKLRDKFKIAPYDRVIVSANRRSIKVSPTRDILDLAGTFRAPIGKNALMARKAMEKQYRRI